MVSAARSAWPRITARMLLKSWLVVLATPQRLLYLLKRAFQRRHGNLFLGGSGQELGMKHVRRGSVGWLAAATFAAALWGVGGLSAQATEGVSTLRGTVFDSTTMSLLPGARVVVMGTTAVGLSRADGSFQLDNVPTGEHWVAFFHARLQSLGVSAPSRRVTFSESGTVDVALAVPSEATLLVGWCLSEQSQSGHAAIAGIVTDSLTGVALPSAIVRAELVDARFGDDPPVEVRTDDSGYYRICSVPAGRPVKLQARFGRSGGRSVQVTVPVGGSSLRDLMLLMSVEGTLRGSVLDYQSGEPLAGASVSVLGTNSRILTDSVGAFVLGDLPPGRHLVVTESLGHDSRTDSVTVFSEEIVGIEIRLATGALDIEGLVVTARSRFGEETLNVGKRLDVMTRAEILPLLQRVRNAGDLLQNMAAPGLRVRETTTQDPATGVRVASMCVEVSRRSAGGAGCRPAAIFLNGVLMSHPGEFLMALDAEIIQRIEILSPIDAAFEFGTLAANGAVKISTH
jgi:hypothetical protein